ncbi:hypothetical protein KM043_018235 [Ampulex compressa]|nr:hypothetical protein KM043_018235 [Ampulex compressa]
MLLAGESEETAKEVSKQLEKYLKIKDLRSTNYYLGIKIESEPDGSFLLDQKVKITKLLEDRELLKLKSVATPMGPGFLAVSWEDSKELDNNDVYRKVMEPVLYIATVSKRNITTAVGLLCRRVEKPTNHDWNAAKILMRYLASTLDRKLRLSSDGDTGLT